MTKRTKDYLREFFQCKADELPLYLRAKKFKPAKEALFLEKAGALRLLALYNVSIRVLSSVYDKVYKRWESEVEATFNGRSVTTKNNFSSKKPNGASMQACQTICEKRAIVKVLGLDTLLDEDLFLMQTEDTEALLESFVEEFKRKNGKELVEKPSSNADVPESLKAQVEEAKQKINKEWEEQCKD